LLVENRVDKIKYMKRQVSIAEPLRGIALAH